MRLLIEIDGCVYQVGNDEIIASLLYYDSHEQSSLIAASLILRDFARDVAITLEQNS